MTKEHPFAQYVRIIGKGPHLSRPLSEQEALEASRMILAGQVEPVQLGAFLCVLRVRTEVPGEGAGFVRAVRETLALPPEPPAVDIDWPSYSGKLRQLPWYLLSALLLAQNGVRVFMHGTEGHTAGRIYARQALHVLGVPVAGSLAEAGEHIRAHNFGFLPLDRLCPKLQEIMELKWVLGLRSPVNTFSRMINPFRAPHEMHSIFHPNYRDVHRDTAQLLGQPNMAVFKGEGGEAERRPHKPVLVEGLREGEKVEEDWPALLPAETVAVDQTMDLARLGALWRGEEEDRYAAATVTGTAAIALRLLRRAESIAQAEAMARELWARRTRERLGAAA